MNWPDLKLHIQHFGHNIRLNREFVSYMLVHQIVGGMKIITMYSLKLIGRFSRTIKGNRNNKINIKRIRTKAKEFLCIILVHQSLSNGQYVDGILVMQTKIALTLYR